MSEKEIINRLALQHVSGVGVVRYKRLIEAFGTATAAFENKDMKIDYIDSITQQHLLAVRNFNNFQIAEDEFKFTEKNNIQILTFDSENYPAKLKRAIDSPTVLFYKGDKTLHNTRVVSIIGTRACSDYGKMICEQIVQELAPANPLVVSGLAYGINAAAHRAALQNGLSTIGVMATGIDTLYPAQHKKIAQSMMENGGLLTEFYSKTKPDRENFPLRNRIVAGMADAVVVIESPIKGGSIITANLAHSYNRDVFSVPGRVTDKRSEGCHELIKSLKAALITTGEDIIEHMNWEETKNKNEQQRKLFVELSNDEKIVYDTLQSSESMRIDDLFLKTQLSMSVLSTLLLQLEMSGMVKSLPGKIYQAI